MVFVDRDRFILGSEFQMLKVKVLSYVGGTSVMDRFFG